MNGNSMISKNRYLGKNGMKRNTSSVALRNRYLSKLGFHTRKECNAIERQGHLHSRAKQKSLTTKDRSCLHGGNKYHCSINDESSHTTGTVIDDEMDSVGEDEAPVPPSCVTVIPNQDYDTSATNKSIINDDSEEDAKTNNTRKTRSVSFNETVTVLTIPNKDSYSDRIRKYIWTEPHERMQNAARNVIEFSSENWDWRLAADDVEFYVCPVTGEKIHPCHNICSYHESATCYRPISRHPFFEKSRQAAMEWENDGTRYMLSFQ